MEDASSFCAGSKPASLNTAPATPARSGSKDSACRTSMWWAKITVEWVNVQYFELRERTVFGCTQQRESIMTTDVWSLTLCFQPTTVFLQHTATKRKNTQKMLCQRQCMCPVPTCTAALCTTACNNCHWCCCRRAAPKFVIDVGVCRRVSFEALEVAQAACPGAGGRPAAAPAGNRMSLAVHIHIKHAVIACCKRFGTSLTSPA